MTNSDFVKRLILFLALSGMSLAVSAQQRSEIVSCLFDAYQPQIDFYEVLHQLERELMDEGVIQDTLGLDYQMLVERFNEDSDSFHLEKVKVYRYLSPEPFKGCIFNAKTQASLDQTFRYMFLMAIYLDLAVQGSRLALMIDDEQTIWVNGKQVALEKLELKLSEQRKILIEKGVPEAEISLDMKVSKNTRMGLIVDIQTLLRKINIRRVNYYSYE